MTTGAPAPGTLIAGKYLVEGLIGAGGMGVILAARHQQLDQKVAIKLLLESARKHPEVIERFSREARAAAKIQGEHVARVIDVGVLEDGAPYMVMEYLEGRDLAAEQRARGKLPPSEVVDWMLQASEAIAQAHAAKIVHRDLKPANLFLARQADGRSVVKVLDFGISKLVDPEAPGLTKTTSLVGTPYYMSPEQLTAAKTVDTRADIWALGVIMYELLAGGPPFNGTTMPEVVAAILGNQPTPLDSIRDDLPFGLAQVIAQCMRTAPDNRYPHVAALAFALSPFAKASGAERTERIARVLGVGAAMETTLAPDTQLAPRTGPPPAPPAAAPEEVRGFDATMPLSSGVPRVPSFGPPAIVSSKPPEPSKPPAPAGPAEVVHARTVDGVATSSPGPSAARPASRPTGLLVTGGVAVLAAVAGFALVLRARGDAARAPDAVPSAAVVVPATAPPSAEPLPSVAPPASSSVTAEPRPPPSVELATSASSAPAPSASSAPAKPTAKPSAATVAGPATTRTAPPASPPPASAPTPAPAASKNPLDMGIK